MGWTTQVFCTFYGKLVDFSPYLAKLIVTRAYFYYFFKFEVKFCLSISCQGRSSWIGNWMFMFHVFIWFWAILLLLYFFWHLDMEC